MSVQFNKSRTDVVVKPVTTYIAKYINLRALSILVELNFDLDVIRSIEMKSKLIR